ncbi:heme-binding beta-barrel domain-containing protein [Psychromonas sp. MME2]|uniref:heme-binding beta-barrel domain-containing protein n=1 Tax=unclassified Psychromonas TaxID=2614957 RepID=UPI00339BF219
MNEKCVNYGPLTGLIGTWFGNAGKDVAPEPDGIENNNYYETMTFSEASEVTNAEQEVLSAVHYIQKVQRHGDDKVIHHESGYWMWNQQTNDVMHSLVIPRGICVLAAGKVDISGTTVFDVKADDTEKEQQLIQSPFMHEKAKLISYVQQMRLYPDKLCYQQTMVVDIYGKVVEHTDSNSLQRQ